MRTALATHAEVPALVNESNMERFKRLLPEMFNVDDEVERTLMCRFYFWLTEVKTAEAAIKLFAMAASPPRERLNAFLTVA